MYFFFIKLPQTTFKRHPYFNGPECAGRLAVFLGAYFKIGSAVALSCMGELFSDK